MTDNNPNPNPNPNANAIAQLDARMSEANPFAILSGLVEALNAGTLADFLSHLQDRSSLDLYGADILAVEQSHINTNAEPNARVTSPSTPVNKLPTNCLTYRFILSNPLTAAGETPTENGSQIGFMFASFQLVVGVNPATSAHTVRLNYRLQQDFTPNNGPHTELEGDIARTLTNQQAQELMLTLEYEFKFKPIRFALTH